MGNWDHHSKLSWRAREYTEENRALQIDHFIQRCLPVIVDAVRPLGYAVTIHGSKRRDLDLVLIPWVDDAVDVETLIATILSVVRVETGWGHRSHKELEQKPHGRVATTLVADSDIHLDVSIMPRVVKPTPEST